MRLNFEPADRPLNVALFEWLSILVLIFDCKDNRTVNGMPWFAVIAYALVMLWIILAISRQRSRAARWVLTVLDAIVYVAFLFQLTTGDTNVREAMWGGGLIEWAGLVLSLLTLWLLWSRPMSRWIASLSVVGNKSPA